MVLVQSQIFAKILQIATFFFLTHPSPACNGKNIENQREELVYVVFEFSISWVTGLRQDKIRLWGSQKIPVPSQNIPSHPNVCQLITHRAIIIKLVTFSDD